MGTQIRAGKPLSAIRIAGARGTNAEHMPPRVPGRVAPARPAEPPPVPGVVEPRPAATRPVPGSLGVGDVNGPPPLNRPGKVGNVKASAQAGASSVSRGAGATGSKVDPLGFVGAGTSGQKVLTPKSSLGDLLGYPWDRSDESTSSSPITGRPGTGVNVGAPVKAGASPVSGDSYTQKWRRSLTNMGNIAPGAVKQAVPITPSTQIGSMPQDAQVVGQWNAPSKRADLPEQKQYISPNGQKTTLIRTSGGRYVQAAEPDTIAEEAQRDQMSVTQNQGYFPDQWTSDFAPEGTIIAQVKASHMNPGGYFTLPSTIFDNGMSSGDILEHLQVGADPKYGYWRDVNFYRVPKGGLPMARSTTASNPQFGAGGGDQFWFRESDRPKLERVDSMPLDGPFTPRPGLKTTGNADEDINYLMFPWK